MSGPGSGRYTNYVPPASARNKLLSDLFNARAENEAGNIYGAVYQTDATAAATEAVKRAIANVNATGAGGIFPESGLQAGDPQMFPTGVDLIFTGKLSQIQPPDTAEGKDVTWQKAGDPANSFVPDVSSPGAGPPGVTRVDPMDKDKNPGLSVKDMKGETYIPGAPGTGTTSPTVTSPLIGKSPIAKTLELGKSSI